MAAAKKRNYKKERTNESPKRKAQRAARNRARRKLGLKVGDKRTVEHKDGNALNNKKSNLTTKSAKANSAQGGRKGKVAAKKKKR